MRIVSSASSVRAFSSQPPTSFEHVAPDHEVGARKAGYAEQGKPAGLHDPLESQALDVDETGEEIALPVDAAELAHGCRQIGIGHQGGDQARAAIPVRSVVRIVDGDEVVLG